MEFVFWLSPIYVRYEQALQRGQRAICLPAWFVNAVQNGGVSMPITHWQISVVIDGRSTGG